jgi:hypothetical protein
VDSRHDCEGEETERLLLCSSNKNVTISLGNCNLATGEI